MKQSEERTWGMLSHIIPMFTGGIASLIMFFVFRNKSNYVTHHAFHSMVFWFFMWIAGLVAGALTFILIGIPMLWILSIIGFILPIVGGIMAMKGDLFEYPIVGRFARKSLRE